MRSWDSPILFESSSQRTHLGRYSFLTADPVHRVEIQRANYGVDPLLEVEREIERFRQERIEGLPPFQGGAAGVLGFELGGAWERLPRNRRDEFGLPDLAVGIYDWVLAWDHELGRVWIIAHGLTEGVANEDAEQRRVDRVRGALKGGEEKQESDDGCDLDEDELLIVPTSMEGVYSDFSRMEYLDRVQRVIDYIHAGDVFQVNLSQRLLSRAEDASVDLYQRLRRINPAPFSGYFSWSGADGTEKWSIVSASPERFMAVRGGEVETRPIKGTRRRS
ncbi:MAG: chorismate-binding protein, partial [Planctomycetaceae bacterium]|nr:chorismate-binding protein [Planctomycetaceae bacterium]